MRYITMIIVWIILFFINCHIVGFVLYFILPKMLVLIVTFVISFKLTWMMTDYLFLRKRKKKYKPKPVKSIKYRTDSEFTMQEKEAFNIAEEHFLEKYPNFALCKEFLPEKYETEIKPKLTRWLAETMERKSGKVS